MEEELVFDFEAPEGRLEEWDGVSGNKKELSKRIEEAKRAIDVQLVEGGIFEHFDDPNAAPRESGLDSICRPTGALHGPPAGKLPPLAGLIYPRRTKLMEMLHNIPKPKGYIPRMHFPSWVDMPLSQKLPCVPISSFIYSRGRLSEPLRRNHKKEYTLVDPNNLFNYLPDHQYNALHDPSAQRYLQRPWVQKLLRQQGLITEVGEVVCSQKEINQYREYLQHLQTDIINKGMKSQREKVMADYYLQRELRVFVANSDFKIRKELADERQRLLLGERIRGIRYRAMADQENAKSNREELKKEWEDRVKRSRECAEYQKKKREAIKCLGARCPQARADYFEKQSRADLMAYIAKMRKELVKTLKQSDMVMAKSEFQKQNLVLRDEMMAQLAYEREERQRKYKKRINTHRDEFAALTEKRKANERRILAIMRKFLDLWREYVRRRKARRNDPNHQSSWDLDEKTRQTVFELEEISQHEKFDKFIMGLIKMKHEMSEHVGMENVGLQEVVAVLEQEEEADSRVPSSHGAK